MINKIGIFSVGTGGHVLPGSRVLDELANCGFDLNNVVVITGKRNEKRFYKKHKIEILELDLVRTNSSLFHYFRNTLSLFRSLIELNRIIKNKKVSVIFSTGSYISPLVSILGFRYRIPTYLQEQNIYAGLGNYIGSYFVRKVFTSFPKTKNIVKKKIEYVGPVLSKPIEEKNKNSDPHFTIGVQGGSQGSEQINNLIYDTFKDWDGAKIKLVHISGKLSINPIVNNKVLYSHYEFIDNIADYYNGLDIQITRGGGGLLEGASLGIVQLILPYTYGTTSSHQNKNAMYLVQNKAGMLINGDSSDLKKTINKFILDFHEFNLYKKNAESSVKLGARENITRELINEYKKNI